MELFQQWITEPSTYHKVPTGHRIGHIKRLIYLIYGEGATFLQNEPQKIKLIPPLIFFQVPPPIQELPGDERRTMVGVFATFCIARAPVGLQSVDRRSKHSPPQCQILQLQALLQYLSRSDRDGWRPQHSNTRMRFNNSGDLLIQ
ncbi:hypothetical protein ACFVFD_30395 [Streptomyces fimicarius]|uniref:hypothetical protein n=1 Tax=Streptomyces griseus TaxID=1911 RepID=UPI0036AE7ED7